MIRHLAGIGLLVLALVTSAAATARADDQTAPSASLRPRAESSFGTVFESTTASLAAAVQGAARARGSAASTSSEHIFGVGVRTGGSNFGFGGTVRYFPNGPLGVQAEVSHYGIGALGFDYSSTQFNGEVLYRLNEVKLDAPLKLQPYVGGGVSVIHTTFPSIVVVNQTLEGGRNNSSGVVITGGVEVFFEQVPKLGVSGAFEFTSNGDFNSIAIGGPAALIAAHWYLK